MNRTPDLPDPLRVLWAALGAVNPTGLVASPGPCARCGATATERARVKSVVSDKFTGWDDYTGDRTAPGLTSESAKAPGEWDPQWCPACMWGHTTPEVRTLSWVITAEDCPAHPATPRDLRQTLRYPLSVTTAVLLPVSRQKHLLPQAVWGKVRTDDRTLPWGPREAARFAHVLTLRHLGFSEAALRDPTPRFEVLRHLPPATMTRVLSLWEGLAAWRADPVYLHAACLASRATKTVAEVSA